MQTILDLLVDPIEVDDEVPDLEGSIPDKYRPCPFNQKNFVLSNKMEDNALNTQTKLKYWTMDKTLLQDKLVKLFSNYDKIKEPPLAINLQNKTALTDDQKKYYKKIYDLTDILICQSLDQKSLASIIKLCLKESKEQIHIVYRITFYFSLYFLKKFDNNGGLMTFANVLHQKIKIFQEESIIEKYFTRKELDGYLSFIKSYSKNI